MKVYNQDKSQILTDYDLEKGHLEQDTIITVIPEQKAINEVSHYEVIAEYPNGGKDVKKVIDIQGQDYVPEHTEVEQIQVYIPYTADELRKMQATAKIGELKQKLADTDYQAIKYAEGELTASEYEPTKALRRGWRQEINELEKCLV